MYLYIYVYSTLGPHLCRTPQPEAKQKICLKVPCAPKYSQAVSLIQHVLMTLVLRLIMNNGFGFDSFLITCSELFRVSWVNLGYISGDRRQNLTPKFAQVPEQSDSTYGVYLVAAEHL